MLKNKSLFFLILFALSACDGSLKNTHRLHGTEAKIDGQQLTIAMVDELIAKNTKKTGNEPNFTEAVEPNARFRQTPMGAYLETWLPGMEQREQIKLSTSKIIEAIGQNRVCYAACSDAFREEFKNNRQKIDARLDEVTQLMADNELRNHDKFTVFYHAFPNEFRLYQDVLRALKTFEFLTELTTTYPFRDFGFNEKVDTLSEFLQGWWDEYLIYAEEQGESPFPKKDRRHPAASVGLTFFPDSIPYAQKNLLSANVNFLGNNFSPMNSSVFYYLNSTSATGLDIANKLIERSLTPYLLDSDGNLDKSKFDKIAGDLKNIFERYMMSTAGQVAQIFVRKSVVPEVSFMAWNGGEPVWLSKSSGNVIMRERNGQKIFKPVNVFWPNTPEQKADFELFNVVDFMDLFINDPTRLRQKFPVVMDPRAQNSLNIFFDQNNQNNQNTLKIDDFITQDYAQARIRPAAKYFTNQEETGVQIFTLNPIKPEDEKRYEQEIFEVVRDVISNFLANAKNADEFKEGTYKLKSAFINAQENSRDQE